MHKVLNTTSFNIKNMTNNNIYNLPKPKAILFDLDGTLADTAFDLTAAINKMRQKRNLEAMPSEYLRNFASQGAAGLLWAGFGINPTQDDFKAYQLEFLDIYRSNICEDTVLFNGVVELLNILEKNNMPWGIVTNKSTKLTFPLIEELKQKYGMPMPHVIVCGDTTPYPKPHSAPMLYACEQLNIPSDAHIWYLGDDIRDTKAARAANMTSIAAAYGYLGDSSDVKSWNADLIIYNISEINEIFTA
jgi:phosphoglycolate phosphatase